MRLRVWLLAAAGVAAVFSLSAAQAPKGEKKPAISWKKAVLDKTFLAEGVAIADINKDGKMDVIHGEAWYEAPTWKRHEIRPLGKYGDGSRGYSNSFACWTEDINGDGWPDVIVIGFPGQPCHWFENPQNKGGHWKKHEIWHSACNETPLYVDLLGTGKRVLVMGWQPIVDVKGKDGKLTRRTSSTQGQMAYFTPGKDPTKRWEMHPISVPSQPGKEVPGTRQFSHGLGVGDVNGDGKPDVICTGGWWEQPARADGKTPWRFHPANLGDACADMYAYRVDGDAKPDIISSSAHNYGIWWYQQRAGGASPTFIRRDLFPRLVSQTHALMMADINGDGLMDLITGKRWWAHGPKGDADPNAPARVYWFEARRGADGLVTFVPHIIDEDSGIGTQFTVADINGDGLLDVITSNKKGTFVLTQVRK